MNESAATANVGTVTPDNTGAAAQPSGSSTGISPISEKDGAELLRERREAKAKGVKQDGEKDGDGKETVTPDNKAKKSKPKTDDTQNGEYDDPRNEEGKASKEDDGEEEDTDPDDTEDEEPEANPDDDGEGDNEDDDEDPDSDKITIKVNGRMEEVTLEDLIANYSKGKGYEKKMAAVTERETTLNSREATLNARHEEAVNHVVSLGKQLLSQINKDERYSPETMEALRREDPTEWVARRQELADKQESIRRARMLEQQEHERRSTEAKANYDKWADGQIKHLQGKFPEFADKKALESTLSEVGEYLTNTYDFTPEEVKDLVRSSMWEVAIKAMRYDQARSGVKDIAKQIRKAPKMLTPSAKQQQSKLTGLEKQLADKRAELKKTGNQKLAVEVIQLQRKLAAQKKGK